MSLGLVKNPKYKQGYYKPINPEKYIGKEPPIYRSGLELKFFIFCDKNENVTKWASEPFPIPYFDTIQKKWRKYYVDNFVEIKEGTNIKRYLIEIKPFKQTKEPESKRGKQKKNLLYEQMMWKNNCDKWNFCKDFAKKNGLEFIIITEKDLS